MQRFANNNPQSFRSRDCRLEEHIQTTGMYSVSHTRSMLESLKVDFVVGSARAIEDGPIAAQPPHHTAHDNSSDITSTGSKTRPAAGDSEPESPAMHHMIRPLRDVTHIKRKKTLPLLIATSPLLEDIPSRSHTTPGYHHWQDSKRYLAGTIGSQRPTPADHTTVATPVAMSEAAIAAAGIRVPSIATLVRVANTPPAGVKPPYMVD